MDPVTSVGVGMVANLAHDVAQGTVSLATDESLDTRIERAAETVADDYGEFDPHHLLNALDSEEMGERVERFERGDPLRIAEITSAFREQTAATKFVDADPEADVETVVEQFVTELQTELAAEPVAWRRMVLREIKRGSRGVERIEAAQETLAETVRAELDDTRLVSATALKEAIEQSDGQGFEWVTETEFERGRVEDHYCWRRSFTLAEAYCGYPLRRQRPSTGGDSERQDLITELLDTLAEHGGAALLGAPGSGKTTATRLVLAAWYDQIPGGTVLYRKQDAQTPLDPAELNEAIETAREGGPVLVVVEDAARRGTYPVYETVDEFAGDPAVRFLVNSRTEEWRDSESGLRAAAGGFSQAGDDIVRVQSEAFKQVDMPGIDAREVERFVTNYEEVTGRIVSLADPNKLLSQVRSHAGISPMLLLAYHVPVWEGEIDARADGDVPALVANVREVYTLVHGGSERKSINIDDTDRERFRQLALAVNVLNAAEAGVWREHLLGVAEDTKAMLEIDKLLAKLQGPLLFGQEGHQYRTHHPLWSRLYLSEHLEQASSPAAARLRFGECVTTVFELFDSDERRDAVEEFLGETERLRAIAESPTATADELVEKVFGIGTRRPELGPLFGTSDNSQIELPEVCSPETTVRVPFSRASMYEQRGESDTQWTEIEEAKRRHEEQNLDSEALSADYHRHLGHHARQRSAFRKARHHYQQAYEKVPTVDGRNEAKLLNDLGWVAQSLDEYMRARAYHQKSLTIHRNIGNKSGVAKSLNNLGVVARKLSEHERARERHKESLEIKRKIGNRASEANSLGNLGIVARNCGEYDRARTRHKQCLEIERDIGDRAGEQETLCNLGAVAQSVGDYEQARELHQQGLEIAREISNEVGKAKHQTDLGSVATLLGEYKKARERYENGLEIKRDIGDQRGKAGSLTNLGTLDYEQGNYSAAMENYRKAVDISRDIGVIGRALTALLGLSRAAAAVGDEQTAVSACEEAVGLTAGSNIHGVGENISIFQKRIKGLDKSVPNLYHSVLHRVDSSSPDPDTVVNLLRLAWNRRAAHDPNTDAFTNATAAGVAFATYCELLYDSTNGVTKEIEQTLWAADPPAAGCSDAVCAVYDRLTGEEPTHTATELRDRVNQPVSDNDLPQLETLVFSRLLAALEEQSADSYPTD